MMNVSKSQLKKYMTIGTQWEVNHPKLGAIGRRTVLKHKTETIVFIVDSHPTQRYVGLESDLKLFEGCVMQIDEGGSVYVGLADDPLVYTQVETTS